MVQESSYESADWRTNSPVPSSNYNILYKSLKVVVTQQSTCLSLITRLYSFNNSWILWHTLAIQSWGSRDRWMPGAYWAGSIAYPASSSSARDCCKIPGGRWQRNDTDAVLLAEHTHACVHVNNTHKHPQAQNHKDHISHFTDQFLYVHNMVYYSFSDVNEAWPQELMY